MCVVCVCVCVEWGPMVSVIIPFLSLISLILLLFWGSFALSPFYSPSSFYSIPLFPYPLPAPIPLPPPSPSLLPSQQRTRAEGRVSLHSGRHNVQCPRPIICRFNSIASIAALPPALPRALPGPRCMPRDDRSGLFNAKDLLLDGSRKKCSVRELRRKVLSKGLVGVGRPLESGGGRPFRSGALGGSRWSEQALREGGGLGGSERMSWR